MNTVITIGREFGSGGREIGEIIAKHFGIQFYDKELIARAAKDSGLAAEMIEHQDERPTSSFLYNLVMDTYSFGYNTTGFVDMPISHKVFLAQFETIKKVAEEGPCVIVGRCADYALNEMEHVLHLFISASQGFKIENLLHRFKDLKTEDAAIDMMEKKDKQRRNYYNYYSSKKWGHADSYDLTVNSAILGIEGTAKLLCSFIDACEEQRSK